MTARKLQSEIDKTIKKVTEGIEIFEAIYEKINQAATHAIKEKLEGDLKKEIKKLQRYRDQIKTWTASNDIKDKTVLLENRKAIETQMERFKALEKELKTKTFSQAGLNAASKLDPAEVHKDSIRNWLSEMTDSLTTQIDVLEAEQETLTLGLKKKKQSKSQTRLNEIHDKIERHKYHQLKMEAILRMIDNGKLGPEQVDEVKEDVEDYVARNQEDDFEENEFMYEDLNLEEAEIFAIGFGHDEEEPEVVEPPKTPPREELKKEEKESSSSSLRSSLPPARKKEKSKDDTKEKVVRASIPAKPLNLTPRLSGPAPIDPPAPPATLRYASAAAAGTQKSNEQNDLNAIDKLTEQLSTTNVKAKKESTTIQSRPNSIEKPDLPPLEKDISELFATPELIETFKTMQNGLADPSHTEAMLNCSLQSLPDAFDSSKSKNYTPTTPFPVPGYYPQSPLSIFTTTPAIFERFDLDTLFFAFYYRKATFQQFLASRELKRQSWRYHKKFQTWFQRHEEPTEATDEYEQGSYLYFDYEKTWTKKQKSAFRFDYRFLEDDL